MSQPSVQIDPLNSPHPIPWNWVLATLAEHQADHETATVKPTLYYYRSQSLLSPDHQYAAYSRIQMQVQSEIFRSRLSSILFVENLATGDLQAVTPASPLAGNPFLDGESDIVGTISVIMPLSWSEVGDRLLAREFESIFGSDIASDYAVVVDSGLNQVHTIAPTCVSYTNAVLLGWSQHDPNQALFQIGTLGDEALQLCTVDVTGQTRLAPDDCPRTFGHVSSSVWMGPQVQQH